MKSHHSPSKVKSLADRGLESRHYSSRSSKSLTLSQTLGRGLAVGFVATQVLDVLSAFLYENLSEEDRRREDLAREGWQAYEVAVQKIARAFGTELTYEQTKYWGWKFHRAFGLFGGVQYMALREAVPQVKAAQGLGYGVAFYAIADELLIYFAGLTPGPKNFSWKTHARGAVAHIAYGLAAELTAKTFDRIHDYETNEGFARAEDWAQLGARSGARSGAQSRARIGSR